MTDYEKIKESIEKCMTWLDDTKFSEGALSRLQTQIKDIVDITLDINDAVKDLDERVTLLES